MMSAVFNKLNLKAQNEIVVVNAPASFEPELATLSDVEVIREADKAASLEFALAFVTRQDELNRIAETLADKAKGDALLWFAYPKKSSKRYTCDFNRDTGWDRIMELGFRPVRAVAIDEDWSALRFRRREYVKSSKPSR
ncbi:MAG TPA: hypothetical protein VLV83_12620 [Acidobacteriota bacterium]|nr:hypothetical protein [Acidobacteriota bacterium]